MDKEITVDGVRYCPCATPGKRTLVVLDKGFIFAGTLERVGPRCWKLGNVVNVRCWNSGGIGGLSRSASGSGAELDRHADIEFSPERVVYLSQLPEGWS